MAARKKIPTPTVEPAGAATVVAKRIAGTLKPAATEPASGGVIPVLVEEIAASKLNPRQRFDAEDLAELAESIRRHGIIEPLVIRPVSHHVSTEGYNPSKTLYELIAGERRWRAARMIELTHVPAIIRFDLADDDATARQLMLVENLQREDLSPIEEARTYQALLQGGMKQTELAQQIGKSQPYIANKVRLLKLPPEALTFVDDGKLSDAQARAISRWAEFADLATAIAHVTVERGVSSTILEHEHAIEHLHRFLPDGLVVDLPSWGYPFVDEICNKACPLQAYRAGNYGRGYCLRPSHYAQLRARADHERWQRDKARTPMDEAKEAAKRAEEANEARKRTVAENKGKRAAADDAKKRALEHMGTLFDLADFRTKDLALLAYAVLHTSLVNIRTGHADIAVAAAISRLGAAGATLQGKVIQTSDIAKRLQPKDVARLEPAALLRFALDVLTSVETAEAKRLPSQAHYTEWLIEDLPKGPKLIDTLPTPAQP